MSSMSRGATGAPTARPRLLNVNQVYAGKNPNPGHRSLGGRNGGLQAIGKSGGVIRRMPPPAILPSLRAESHGQDPETQIVPQGGQGWNKDSPAPPPAPVEEVPQAPTNGPDLRPNWAKQASECQKEPSGAASAREFPALSTEKARTTSTSSDTLKCQRSSDYKNSVGTSDSEDTACLPARYYENPKPAPKPDVLKAKVEEAKPVESHVNSNLPAKFHGSSDARIAQPAAYLSKQWTESVSREPADLENANAPSSGVNTAEEWSARDNHMERSRFKRVSTDGESEEMRPNRRWGDNNDSAPSSDVRLLRRSDKTEEEDEIAMTKLSKPAVKLFKRAPNGTEVVEVTPIIPTNYYQRDPNKSQSMESEDEELCAQVAAATAAISKERSLAKRKDRYSSEGNSLSMHQEYSYDSNKKDDEQQSTPTSDNIWQKRKEERESEERERAARLPRSMQHTLERHFPSVHEAATIQIDKDRQRRNPMQDAEFARAAMRARQSQGSNDVRQMMQNRGGGDYSNQGEQSQSMRRPYPKDNNEYPTNRYDDRYENNRGYAPQEWGHDQRKGGYQSGYQSYRYDAGDSGDYGAEENYGRGARYAQENHHQNGPPMNGGDSQDIRGPRVSRPSSSRGAQPAQQQEVPQQVNKQKPQEEIAEYEPVATEVTPNDVEPKQRMPAYRGSARGRYPHHEGPRILHTHHSMRSRGRGYTYSRGGRGMSRTHYQNSYNRQEQYDEYQEEEYNDGVVYEPEQVPKKQFEKRERKEPKEPRTPREPKETKEQKKEKRPTKIHAPIQQQVEIKTEENDQVASEVEHPTAKKTFPTSRRGRGLKEGFRGTKGMRGEYSGRGRGAHYQHGHHGENGDGSYKRQNGFGDEREPYQKKPYQNKNQRNIRTANSAASDAPAEVSAQNPSTVHVDRLKSPVASSEGHEEWETASESSARRPDADDVSTLKPPQTTQQPSRGHASSRGAKGFIGQKHAITDRPKPKNGRAASRTCQSPSAESSRKLETQTRDQRLAGVDLNDIASVVVIDHIPDNGEHDVPASDFEEVMSKRQRRMKLIEEQQKIEAEERRRQKEQERIERAQQRKAVRLAAKQKKMEDRKAAQFVAEEVKRKEELAREEEGIKIKSMTPTMTVWNSAHVDTTVLPETITPAVIPSPIARPTKKSDAAKDTPVVLCEVGNTTCAAVAKKDHSFDFTFDPSLSERSPRVQQDNGSDKLETVSSNEERLKERLDKIKDIWPGRDETQPLPSNVAKVKPQPQSCADDRLLDIKHHFGAQTLGAPHMGQARSPAIGPFANHVNGVAFFPAFPLMLGSEVGMDPTGAGSPPAQWGPPALPPPQQVQPPHSGQPRNRPLNFELPPPQQQAQNIFVNNRDYLGNGSSMWGGLENAMSLGATPPPQNTQPAPPVPPNNRYSGPPSQMPRKFAAPHHPQSRMTHSVMNFGPGPGEVLTMAPPPPPLSTMTSKQTGSSGSDRMTGPQYGGPFGNSQRGPSFPTPPPNYNAPPPMRYDSFPQEINWSKPVTSGPPGPGASGLHGPPKSNNFGPPMNGNNAMWRSPPRKPLQMGMWGDSKPGMSMAPEMWQPMDPNPYRSSSAQPPIGSSMNGQKSNGGDRDN